MQQKKSILHFFPCRKRNNRFHFNFKGVFTKGLSARNGVKMVVPAVLSWETKLKKPQRKRKCSMINKKSKSCMSPADLTWVNGCMLVSSGCQAVQTGVSTCEEPCHRLENHSKPMSVNPLWKITNCRVSVNWFLTWLPRRHGPPLKILFIPQDTMHTRPVDICKIHVW